MFVPDTALLVPGAAGRAVVLSELREQAVAALAEAVGNRPGRVVVIAPGSADRYLAAPVTTGLGAAGIPERVVGGGTGSGARPGAPAPGGGRPRPSRADVAASAALVLLGLAGSAPDVVDGVDVLEVGRRSTDGAALRRHGVELAEPAPATVVVVGSLSARHGPDAPLPDDPRAAAVDARLLAALQTGERELTAVLDDLGAGVATELAVSGWGPWQVASGLVAAWSAARAGATSCGRLHGHGTPFGAQHAVASWWLDAEASPSAAPSQAQVHR